MPSPPPPPLTRSQYGLSVSRVKLNGNKIDEVDPRIGNMGKLKELRLGGNLLSDLPPEVRAV